MRTFAALVALMVATRSLAGQVEHVTDQFGGSEAWFTKQTSLARLPENRCDIWLVFRIERTKQTTTEFVRVDYLSIPARQPLGAVADVTLQFAVGHSTISGQAFRPVTADKRLIVKGSNPTTAEVPQSGDINQSFFFALPSGTLQRLAGGSTKMRAQGSQRTCDAALD